MVGGGFMGMDSNTIRVAKMKRKEADDLTNDFSDFSLSSPATKIRRLDAELPPIMEEEEPDIPFPSSMAGAPGSGRGRGSGGPVIRELDDDEKAIVLFKPFNSSLFHNSPSSTLSLSVDSNFISGFKDQLIRATNQKSSMGNDGIGVGNECQAIVPWAPPYQLMPPVSFGAEDSCQEPVHFQELMEAEEELEEEDEDSMEVEEDTNLNTPKVGLVSEAEAYSGIRGGAGEGIHQWHQQHCMLPQPPHNISTPVTWFQ
ncbi:uncharacterized protein LOC133829608 [Humulus lupulus]|uniref:uncharacterized protein LOC133829608 n=1 Tax=Humulus lupulus TaxID=3486 RepID=UPI002B402465|nr:uncharacterized protein LOC133829608 [Humulus lupulus]